MAKPTLSFSRNPATAAEISSRTKTPSRMEPARLRPARRCAAPGRIADRAVQPMSAPAVSGRANRGRFGES
ncbi:hypothetical protein [Planobispora siamensis]|uniref:hypothetical protein n=1 Tax=Planobispora siamensis TaxID=936338 RepID=UPI001EF1CA65|nr:hypothetical protein [Planobispora siamensis]